MPKMSEAMPPSASHQRPCSRFSVKAAPSISAPETTAQMATIQVIAMSVITGQETATTAAAILTRPWRMSRYQRSPFRAAAWEGDEGAGAPQSRPAFTSDESALPGDDLSGDDPPEREFPQSHANGATLRRPSPLDESEPDAVPPLPDVLRVDAEELAQKSVARRRTIGYGGAAVAMLVLLAGSALLRRLAGR